mgnify:CR=1 FL=1
MTRANPAPGQRAAQKLRTRRALADAARELFVQTGYGETKAEAIAARAGVSRATFYLHFASKAEIVTDLMRSLAGDLAENITNLAKCTTREATHEWLESHAELWREYEAEFIAMREALGTEQKVADEWFAFVNDVSARMSSPEGSAQTRVAISVFLLGLERTYASVLQQGYSEPWELVREALTQQWLGLVDAMTEG